MKKISFILFTALAIFMMYSLSPHKTAHEEKIVSSTMARKTTIYDFFTFKGVLKESKKSEILLPKTAKISNIYVKVGDYVNAGDKIVDLEYLDDSDINYPEMYSKYKTDILNDVSNIDILSSEQSSDGETMYADTADTAIFAPISGMVMEMYTDEGQVAFGASAIAVISDLSKLVVVSSVNEDRVLKLYEGMESEVKVDALSDETFSGELSAIAPYARKVSNIIGQPSETKTDVWVDIKDTKNILKPGYTASVKVTTSTKENALVVPYECITQDENNKEYVLVINNQRIFERRYVTCGYELDNSVEITDGLDNDSIIALHPEGIKEGSAVSKTVRNAKD